MRPYEIPAWKQAPFLRLLLPFTAGILTAYYLQPPLKIILAVSVFLIIPFIISQWLPVGWRYILTTLQGLVLSLIIFCMGILFTWKADDRHHPHWFGHIIQPGDTLLGTIDEELQEKQKSYKTTLRLVALQRKNERVAVNGKLVLYFSKDSTVKLLQPGYLIQIHQKLSPINHSGNPGSFNYKEYAARQGIFHSAYLTTSAWQLLEKRTLPPLPRLIHHLRKKVLGIMQRRFESNPPVRGIAEALLIGYKENLDRNIVQEYTQAGVVHIIAISGLHLGLIYWVITTLLAKIPFTGKRPAIQFIISLLSLWLFALLTGASASVLRSAVMFSCMLLGKLLSRQTTVYQSLATSAFLLLAWDPYMLWDVGFQLSYLALAGIVFLQKPILNSIIIKNKWLRKTWEMLAVTLAAQIGAFPICLYYFHQFPTWFFLANLVAVPLSTLILFLEIALVALSGWDMAGNILTWLCTHAIQWMNLVIHANNAIPGSLISGIYADVPSTILLHGAVIGLAGYFVKRKNPWLMGGLLCACGWILAHSVADIRTSRQRSIILYNIPGHSAVDFVEGGTCVFLGDDELKAGTSLEQYHLGPSRTAGQFSASDSPMAGFRRSGNLLWFYGKTMLVIDRDLRINPNMHIGQGIDMLLIRGNPRINIRELFSCFQPSIMVFDPSNSLWKITKWKKECEALPLRCYSIPERGARVIPCGDPLRISFPDR